MMYQKIRKRKRMEKNDIMKIIFTDPKKYGELTKTEKSSNYFYVNKRMAIRSPLKANAMNFRGINQEAVVDVWQGIMSRNFTNVPGWIYTSGKEVKEKKLNIDETILSEYLKKYKYSRKDFYGALKINEKGTMEEYKKFEELYK